MFPFTAGKMVSYEDIRSYLIDRNVPQIFESIMTGLMYHRPEDHLSYIEQCVAMIKQCDDGELSWNTFIECSPPKIQPLPPVPMSSTGRSNNHNDNGENVSPDMNRNATLPPISSNPSSNYNSRKTSIIPNKKMTHALISNEEYSIPDCPIVFLTGVPSSGILDVEQKITHIAGGFVCISLNVLAKDIHECDDYVKYLQIPSGCLVEDLIKCMHKFQEAKAIVILGYPRNISDLQDFTEMVCEVDAVLMLDYKESVHREKLEEAYGESDVISTQIEFFKEHTLPAVEMIEELGVLNIIDVEDDESMVMDTIMSTLNVVLENYTAGQRKCTTMFRRKSEGAISESDVSMVY